MNQQREKNTAPSRAGLVWEAAVAKEEGYSRAFLATATAAKAPSKGARSFMVDDHDFCARCSRCGVRHTDHRHIWGSSNGYILLDGVS